MSESPRRQRRTKFSLEKDFIDAVKSVIESEGFSKTTVAAITEKAEIVPNVFYKRYNSLDELFDEYVKRYDYWLVDIGNNIDLSHIDNYEDLFEKILTDLVESLYNNKSMQQLLVWELGEENNITLRSSRLREENSRELVDKFYEGCKDINSNIDIRVVAALYIAGIYYLILHKNRSTFCNIDFNKKEGKQLLLNNIGSLTRLLFNNNVKDETYRIARKMKAKGIDLSVISEVTGLTIDEIEADCE